MQVDRNGARWFAAIAIALGTTLASAFEPGTTRVCEPSADGSRFECRDKTAAAPTAAQRDARTPPDPAASDRVVPAVVSEAARGPDQREPDTAPAAVEPAATPQPARSASELPNYLRQNPAAADVGAQAEAAREAAAPAATSDIAAHVPATEDTAPASAQEVPRATSVPADNSAAAARTPGPVASDEADVVDAHAESPAVAPEPQTAPNATPAHAPSMRTADAQAFRQLAGTRYTLEIARARNASDFGALIAALAGIDGTLYVIGLRNPQGTAHSLVWSDFPSIEAAREARNSLPADVAITSGWPRRIGPLQAELIGP